MCLKVKGVGFVDPLTKNTSDVQLSNVRLDYPEWEPGRGARGSVYVSAHFNSLAQHHSLRFPLDSPYLGSDARNPATEADTQ